MNKEFHSTSMSNNNKIACSFCDETFPSSTAMSEHLILCGNKTDPCPVCHRFIRRAIFAYHYENKCAKLDESTDSDKSKSNSSDARQTRMSKIIRCEFCRKDCYQEDYDQHKKKCVNRRKDIASSNQNRSFVHQHHNDTDIVYIPCQFCDNPIESSNLINHQKACNTHRKTSEQQSRHVNQIFTEQLQCVYCNNKFQRQRDQHIHQNICYKNPDRKSYAAVAAGSHGPSSTT